MAALERGRGTSKTRVSPVSNSNSFPHSGTGQLSLTLVSPISVRCLTTTQVPHFGQVTHEHECDRPYTAIILRHQRAASPGIGRGLSLLDFRNFPPPYALWVGSRVDDSPICGTKFEGTPLQSVAITDAKSGRCPRHAFARAFDGNHLPAYTGRCGPAPRPIPDLVTGVPHRGRKQRPRPIEVPQGKHHGHATQTGPAGPFSIPRAPGTASISRKTQAFAERQ